MKKGNGSELSKEIIIKYQNIVLKYMNIINIWSSKKHTKPKAGCLSKYFLRPKIFDSDNCKL